MTVEIIISQPNPIISPVVDSNFVEQVEITCYSQLLEIVDNQCNVPWIQTNIQFLNTIKGEKGDPGSGSTLTLDFTTSDWQAVAGGFELSLQHNLDADIQATIYENNNEVIVDKNLFNKNTVKLFVPYDYRFNGYAIIKN